MISDASPLIFLSKIGRVDLLKLLFKIIIITSEVRDEVLNEEKQEFNILKNAIEKGWIKIKDPKKNLDLGLGKGENSSINLAIELKDSLITDDLSAVKSAKALGINVLRTTTLIFLALNKKIISKKGALNLFNQIIDKGYYISPQIYKEIVKELNYSQRL